MARALTFPNSTGSIVTSGPRPAGLDSPSRAQAPSPIRNSQATPRSPVWPCRETDRRSRTCGAHRNHSLDYEITTRLERRRTRGSRPDRAGRRLCYPGRLEFSRFNIDSLLKLANVKALSGDRRWPVRSPVAGPLAHPEELHGEARLQEPGSDHCRRAPQEPGRRPRHPGQRTHPPGPLARHREDTDCARRAVSPSPAHGNWTWPPAAPSTSSWPRPSIPTSPPAEPPPSRWKPMGL